MNNQNVIGIVNNILEFSENWESYRNDWKYTVKNYDEGIEIEYWEKENDKYVKKDSFNICHACSRLLFKSISNYFDEGLFDEVG